MFRRCLDLIFCSRRPNTKMGSEVQVMLNNIKFQESYKVSMDKLEKNW